MSVAVVPVAQRFATASDGCATTYAWLSAGDRPADRLRTDGITIHWNKVLSAEIGKPSPTPGFQHRVRASTGNGYWDVHVSAENLPAALAAARDLVRLCRPAPPRQASAAPVPAGPAPAPRAVNLTARREIRKDVAGVPICRFDDIPELLLRRGFYSVRARADFVAPAREDTRVRFVVGMQDYKYRKPRPGWHHVTPHPAILLPWGADVSGAGSARLLVDGRDTRLQLERGGEADHFMSATPGHPILSIHADGGFLASGWPAQLASLQSGSTLTLVINGAGGAPARYNFDISRLRHVPAALTASNWLCPPLS